MIGQYAHGNEPSHHIAYMYAYSNKPEKGKQLITQICKQFYNNTPTGIIGNDDCGQMSAWYIFSTLGFYPVNPANATYIIGQPQVQAATIHLPSGKKLLIKNNNKKSVLWNRTPIKGYEISHQQMVKGGVLDF
jgi:putative alpha-1,2-mannosidase